MSNKNLSNAKKAKNDEFYTQLYDIENEVLRYITPSYNPFDGKTVLCPCDDPVESNFTRFFALNFSRLGLKKLISTGYNKDGKGKVYVLTGDTDGNGVIDIDDIVSEDLEGDGDFRSEEVTRLRAEADIIVTNPPFSMFIDFINWINPDEKKFIIMGNKNAVAVKDVFPLIRDNKLWLGITQPSEFNTGEGKSKLVKGLVRWFTNIPHINHTSLMPLLSRETHEANGIVYREYDNYNAIEVPAVKVIPSDYTGVMGVPITFMDNYNPEQFEIITCACGNSWANYRDTLLSLNFNPNMKYGGGLGAPLIDGKPVYSRLLIRNKLIVNN